MKNKNKAYKFPVARIKRIMQKDEEVGKVAQATPVAISKALELFLEMIVEEASKVTIERGSRKVEAYHLKHAIQTVEMLDFLKEIVEAVPDPSAGGTIDVEAENADARSKRRGKGKDKKSDGDTNGDDKPAPKRRRKNVGENHKEKEKEEDDGNGQRLLRREDDDDHWEV